MKTWTISQLLEDLPKRADYVTDWEHTETFVERPCKGYQASDLYKVWPDKSSITLLELLDLKIPDGDKVDVCCKRGALTKMQLMKWFARTMVRALRNDYISHNDVNFDKFIYDFLKRGKEGRIRATTIMALNAGLIASKAACDISVARPAAEHERALQVEDLRQILRETEAVDQEVYQ